MNQQLTDIPTAQLVAELQLRKTQHRAEAAGIERALGERNNFQLPDARLALDVAMAIAEECNLADPFCLVERNRHSHLVTPRRLLHWHLRVVAGWSFQRIGLHCERNHAAIISSVRHIQSDRDFYTPIIERIHGRLAA
jgi:chromosomal replication initiation ATPase DnaA